MRHLDSRASVLGSRSRLAALGLAGALLAAAAGCGESSLAPGSSPLGDPFAGFGGEENDDSVQTQLAQAGEQEADSKADRQGGAAVGRTVLLQLDSHPVEVAGKPSAVAYLPARFDAGTAVNVVVFLHGWYNCAENVVRASGKACLAGRGARQAYNLAGQLEAAGKNALLLVPEMAFDRASSEPGQLADPDGLRQVIGESLEKLGVQLPDLAPLLTLDRLGQVVLASHSGGYRAAAAIATQGGVDVQELYLLDSLYGEDDAFDAWITQQLDQLASAPQLRRLASVYSATGGTLAGSQAMATRARGWLADAAFDPLEGYDPAALKDDRTTATWTAADFGHGLLFKRTSLSHDNTPRYYFGRLLATSLLPQVP